jgi:anti-anti-sigma factor
VEIEVRQVQERVTVLAPRGRLDLASAPAFREHVTQLVDSGVAHIVVDLGTVSFVDSSGLGALISGLKRARENGGGLRIARPNAVVQLLLNETELNRVLRPYAAVEEALADF